MRTRTDTFWHHTDSENADFFQSIFRGEHLLYFLDREAEVNLDYNRTKRSCWRVLHKETNNPVDGLRSTTTYRLSLVWSIVHAPHLWSSSDLDRLKADLPKIAGKRNKHSRHRCGNVWCCNPQHIQIGERTSNEVDKHFHYFLRHTDESVCTSFMDQYQDLCRAQRVWGRYPVPNDSSEAVDSD